jgi:hypothetical protein
MRLLIEILVVGALIYLGWERPFKQWADQARAAVRSEQAAPGSQEGVSATATSTPIPLLRPIIRATPPSGAWMWDPKHRGTLDRPAPSPTIRP